MMSDASEMLAAALEQMDGIIAGNHSALLGIKDIGYGVQSHLGSIQNGKRQQYVQQMVNIPSRCLLLFYNSLVPIAKSPNLYHYYYFLTI